MRGAGRAAGTGAQGAWHGAGAGAARRGWARPRCWSTWPEGRGVPARAGHRGAVGDGAGLCRAASAVRADAEPRGVPAGAAAGGAADRVRAGRWLAAGPVPGRAGVLSLLSEVAAERPLVCVIDDGQWLDHASAQALGIMARRLAVDPVGLVFAARVPGEELTGLRELTVAGLPDADARVLLSSALAGPRDARGAGPARPGRRGAGPAADHAGRAGHGRGVEWRLRRGRVADRAG